MTHFDTSLHRIYGYSREMRWDPLLCTEWFSECSVEHYYWARRYLGYLGYSRKTLILRVDASTQRNLGILIPGFSAWSRDRLSRYNTIWISFYHFDPKAFDFWVRTYFHQHCLRWSFDLISFDTLTIWDFGITFQSDWRILSWPITWLTR